jgi:nucleoside transporter
MKLHVKMRLSTMMFLEFFIWSSWFVTLGSFLAANLAATGAQSAQAYSTQSWGAICAPFIVGLIADKYVNAERLLGGIHLIGALLMYLLARAHSFPEFYPYLLAYMILYMSTLALVNSISFRQMDDPAREFSKIRIWGTLGWITAGLVISYGFSWDSPVTLQSGALKNTFLMCSFVSALLGLYSFTLPRTPPRVKRGEALSLRDMLGIDALSLLKDRNFLVFTCASILICIPLAFYYQYTNQFLTEIHVANATGKQTLGQMSEVLFMLLIPFCLLRMGMKITLLVGMIAWAVRYALFALGNSADLAWMLLLGIALHGVCYDFFFVSGQIFTDSKASIRYKSAAQGLITLATYGLGMLVGFWAAGRIADSHVAHGVHDWNAIWLYPSIFAALVAGVFLVVFKNERLNYRIGNNG